MAVTGILHLVLGLALSAPGDDILYLKDGTLVDGLQLERTDDGVLAHFEHGEVAVAWGLIQEVLIADEPYVPKTDEEIEKYEKGLVPFEGRWVKESRRRSTLDQRLRERREVLAEEIEHRLWRNRRQEKTKHFEFEATVPLHVFERYRDLMEQYFTIFAKDWSLRQPKDLGRLKVCFYIDRKDFHQISGAPGNVAGYFKFVEPMELNFFYDPLDAEFTEDVMFHEANHYLTKLIDVDFSYPHFPGESLAEYYGASDYDEKTGRISAGLIQEGRLTEIQTDIAGGRFLGLEELITTDGMYEHYNWGWSLVHFLMQDRTLAKKFQKFVLGLARDKNVRRESMSWGLKTVSAEETYKAFRRFLGLKKDEDVAALEAEWHAYVKDQLQLVSPRGMEKAAFAAASTYPMRRLRALRLFRESIAAGNDNPRAYDKLADILMMEDKSANVAEAMELWREAISLAPLNPTYYASLGMAEAEHGDAKEGQRLMNLALELDPDGEHRILETVRDVWKETPGR